MGKIYLGVNMEFVRHHDKSFSWGVEKAAEIGLEPHQQYSQSQEGLDSIYTLVPSPAIGINYDTGNSYLAGTTDTYSWLAHVRDRLVHLHAKDISFTQSSAEKGKVTGTPVGCACGEGVVDWQRIIDIVKPCPNDIVFSVECGTVPDAIKSFEHLSKLRQVVEKNERVSRENFCPLNLGAPL